MSYSIMAQTRPRILLSLGLYEIIVKIVIDFDPFPRWRWRSRAVSNNHPEGNYESCQPRLSFEVGPSRII